MVGAATSKVVKEINTVKAISAAVAHATDAVLFTYTATDFVTIQGVYGDFALTMERLAGAVAGDPGAQAVVTLAYSVTPKNGSVVTLDTESNMQAKKNQFWKIEQQALTIETPLNMEVELGGSDKTRRTLQPGDKYEVVMRIEFGDAAGHDCTYRFVQTMFLRQK